MLFYELIKNFAETPILFFDFIRHLFLSEYLLIFSYLATIFIITQIKKDPSIGNFTWGGGVLLLTLDAFFHQSKNIGSIITSRKILITTLVVFWSLRLIIYLYLRYKKGADPRFIEWQKEWGKLAILRGFIWVVILQGALMLIMSYLPVMAILNDPRSAFALYSSFDATIPLNYLDFIGLVIWIIGYFFESVGDFQLYKFLKNPQNKGKIMDQGLWRYTRHPNYFGEILMWWGLYLIACSTFHGITTIITPLTITILLIFFTGIPWAEGVFKDNPLYQEYKKRTGMLIPWWPKNSIK